MSDEAILAALDLFEWRTLIAIRSRLKYRGEAFILTAALRRLAETGIVEQMRKNTGIRRMPQHAARNPTFLIECYRRF